MTRPFEYLPVGIIACEPAASTTYPITEYNRLGEHNTRSIIPLSTSGHGFPKPKLLGQMKQVEMRFRIVNDRDQMSK